jgi:hypothetical protein
MVGFPDQSGDGLSLLLVALRGTPELKNKEL